jgi:hypothetical protein
MEGEASNLSSSLLADRVQADSSATVPNLRIQRGISADASNMVSIRITPGEADQATIKGEALKQAPPFIQSESGCGLCSLLTSLILFPFRPRMLARTCSAKAAGAASSLASADVSRVGASHGRVYIMVATSTMCVVYIPLKLLGLCRRSEWQTRMKMIHASNANALGQILCRPLKLLNLSVRHSSEGVADILIPKAAVDNGRLAVTWPTCSLEHSLARCILDALSASPSDLSSPSSPSIGPHPLMTWQVHRRRPLRSFVCRGADT